MDQNKNVTSSEPSHVIASNVETPETESDALASDKIHVTHAESGADDSAPLTSGAESSTSGTPPSPPPEFINETSEPVKIILSYFINTGLHGGNWPNVTWNVCNIKYEDSRSKVAIFKNMSGKHAEFKSVQAIKQKRDKIESVTIYSNYSPCNMSGHECSTKLIELKKEMKMEIKIRFAALYTDIIRPSCWKNVKCKNGHVQGQSEEDSPLAFRKLQELGAKPFQEEDWNDLINLLSKDKEANPEELKAVRYGEKYRKWRDSEDDTMRRDFMQLSHLSSPVKRPSSARPSGPIKKLFNDM